MRITRSTSTSSRRRVTLPESAGFTIAELLTVVSVIAVLVSLLCAALNSTKAKALRINCLDNMRQLQLAWQTYSEDNADYLALNQTAPVPNKGGAVPNRLSGESWVAGNPLYDLSTTNIERGSLFQYTRSTAIYRCPMDDSTVSGHPDTLRTRSYSMDAYLGGDPDLARPPKLRSTELANQSANVFVFIEEDETDGFGKSSSFLVLPRTPVPTAWFSKPARRHSGGCNITFADGHIEYWHWRGQKDTTAQISMSSLRDDPDMHRLQNWLPQ